MSSRESSREFLGDGLLDNEAPSATRELPAVVADDDAPVLLATSSGPGGAADRGAGGVSDTVLFLLTVNVVIGSGIVGLPFAFNQAGLITSLLSMLGC
ncbi:hypothetical protein T492DRAFT_895167, partial [Pavlovales sp. CCMP2436]